MPTIDYATEHESAFIESFIIRERRDRYRTKLRSPKHRRSFLGRLNHQFHKDLDARFVLSAARSWPKNVERCYVIADEKQYDGKITSPTEAADAIALASFGIVISFVPGKLACYRDESPADVVWLQRK